MKNKSQQKKQIAKSLYLNTSLHRKEIAHHAGCTEATLRGWIANEGWEQIKEAKTITRGELLKDAYGQLKAINQAIQSEYNGVPTKELSDAKAVIRKEIEVLGENPLHIYIEVFEELLAFVCHTSPDQLKGLSGLFQSFVGAKQNGSI